VASGGLSIVRNEHSSLAALRKVPSFEEDSLSEIVKRFWEIDNSCGESPTISAYDELLRVTLGLSQVSTQLGCQPNPALTR